MFEAQRMREIMTGRRKGEVKRNNERCSMATSEKVEGEEETGNTCLDKDGVQIKNV